MTNTFKFGDIVCHKAAFLRSISWFTDVPKNGRVCDVSPSGVLTVAWCSGETNRIHSANVILYAERHKEPV